MLLFFFAGTYSAGKEKLKRYAVISDSAISDSHEENVSRKRKITVPKRYMTVDTADNSDDDIAKKKRRKKRKHNIDSDDAESSEPNSDLGSESSSALEDIPIKHCKHS